MGLRRSARVPAWVERLLARRRSMRGSFVGQVPRQRGRYRVRIGLAGVCLAALPLLALPSQESGAALLPLAENCNPPTITSAGSVTATAGASFNFTVTTCT